MSKSQRNSRIGVTALTFVACVTTPWARDAAAQTAPEVACEPTSCTVQAGSQITLISDAAASSLPYHTYTWQDANATVRTYNRHNAAPAYRTTQVFDANGFQTADARNVTVTTCSSSYGSGTCTNRDITVTITAPTPAGIACRGPPGHPELATGSCAIQAGRPVDIVVDSRESTLPYVTISRTNPAGGAVTYNFHTQGYGYNGGYRFDTSGFPATETNSVRVEANACRSNYNSGTCVRSTQVVAITPAPTSTVTCLDDRFCNFDSGAIVELLGDSSPNRFRYHRWRWIDGRNISRVYDYDTESYGYTSRRDVDTRYFNGANVLTVNFSACTGGSGTGTCDNVERRIVLRRPAAPQLTCGNPAGPCTARAGEVIELHGDAVQGQLRYHRWTYPRAVGAPTTYDVDGASGYRTRFSFTTNGYNPTTPLGLDVTLQACTNGYGVGTCELTTRTINVIPAPTGAIECENPNCRLQLGSSMQVRGQSIDSRLRYHRWTWLNSSGGVVQNDRDASTSNYTSEYTFSGNGFTTPTDVRVTLITCSGGYGTGTCVTQTQDVSLFAAPPPRLECLTSNGACTVVAGRQLPILANGSDAEYGYHRWTYRDSTNAPRSVNYGDTTDFRTQLLFDTNGYRNTSPVDVLIEVVACKSSYGSGSCANRTQIVRVLPSSSPDIECEGPCVGTVGQNLALHGSSENSLMRYHRWTYRNASNTLVNFDRDTYDYGFQSRLDLNTNGFTLGGRDVTLQACTAYWNSGTCAETTVTATLTAAAVPTIECDEPGGCTFPAGEIIRLAGSSVGSQYRYQQWTWRDGRNNLITTNRDTVSYAYRSSLNFDSRYFSGDATNTAAVTLNACTGGYNSGSCVTATRDLTITPAVRPEIRCEGGNCSMIQGRSVRLLGQSTSQFRYHRYTWNNAANAGTNYDTSGSAPYPRTSYSWSSSTFSAGDTRAVVLRSCTNGYNVGTCRDSLPLSLTVQAPPAVYLFCSPWNCRTNPGDSMTISIDSRGSSTRYFTMTYTDGDGAPQSTNTYTGAFSGSFTISGTTFDAPATRTVTVRACTTGYGSGVCETANINVQWSNGAGPVISCETADCSVQEGRSLYLTADAVNTDYPYFTWTWPNLLLDFDPVVNNQPGSYYNRADISFDARGYNVTANRTIPVQLRACRSSYGSGGCVESTRNITITPASNPTITCQGGSCDLQTGQQLVLYGHYRTNNHLQYVEWRYRNGSNAVVVSNHTTLDYDHASSMTLEGNGFTPGTIVPVELWTCSNSYRNGTCQVATQNVRILPAVRPILSCDNGDCAVQAGRSIRLFADNQAARFRYHTWSWPRPTGDTYEANSNGSYDYATSHTFDSGDFNVTANTPVPVTVMSCDQSYRVGSCTTATTTVTVSAAPAPTINCPAGNCTVQGGLSISLVGEAGNSQLRYHTWRWRDGVGNEQIYQTTADSRGFTSRFLMPATTFSNADVVNVELEVCQRSYSTGTCARRTRAVTITAIPTPTMICDGGPCEVMAGQSLRIFGVANDRLRYHQFRWTNAASQQRTSSYDTFYTGGRSSFDFVASNHEGRVPETRTIELISCATGYNTGDSCARTTRVVTITPVPTPTIRCRDNSCVVEAGRTLELVATSSIARQTYHRWRWVDGNGLTTTVDLPYAQSYGWSYPVTFDARYFQSGGVREVELVSCTGGYETGTCARTTTNVTILAPAVSRVYCHDSATCSFRAGEVVSVQARSSTPLRYHSFRWRDPSNSPQIIDTYHSNPYNETRANVNTGGAPSDRPSTIAVTTYACTNSYLAGTCVSNTATISLTPPRAPEIYCPESDVGFEVAIGSSLFVAGRSPDGRLRYHRYRWETPSGAQQYSDYTTSDTPQAYGSSFSFSTSEFQEPASPVLRLIACSTGYESGTCVETQQVIQVRPASLGTIDCNPRTCRLPADSSITLIGDTARGQLRYHRWTWTDASNMTVQTDRDAGGSFRSSVQFSSAGMTPATTRRVDLLACSTGFGTGNCARIFGEVGIDARPAPTIECGEDSGPCTVQDGHQINLYGDSVVARTPYHTWRWTDYRGAQASRNDYVLSTAYRSVAPFDARSFLNQTNRPVAVELVACDGGYRTGNCGSRAITVTVTPAPAPTIECRGVGGACTVTAGQTVRLRGDSSNSTLRYHTWSFYNNLNRRLSYNNDTGAAGYASERDFNAAGFAAGDTRTLELQACSTNYNTGTCVTTTRVLQITAAGAPTIECPGNVCQVQTGLPIELTGDSAASQFRYHQWRWRDGAGQFVVYNIDSASGGFRTLRSLDTRNFSTQQPHDVAVALTACTTGYESGTCVRTEQNIRLTVPPAPVLTCADGNCSVQAGQLLSMANDSFNSRLRYHEWRTTDVHGNLRRYQVDTLGSNFRSEWTYNADNFVVDSTRLMTVTACAYGYGQGACRESQLTISVFLAQPPSIECSSPNCEIQAGTTLGLIGDGSQVRFPYHTWIWPRASGIGEQRYNEYTAGNGFRSGANFNTAGFEPTTQLRVPVRLVACDASYETGSCSERTVTARINPAPTPSFRCPVGGCTVPAGSTIDVIGNSSNSRFRYHTFTWQNAAGNRQSLNRSADTTAFQSSLNFSALGFQGGATRTVTLNACSTTYNSGTCVTGSQVVTIVEPAQLLTVCRQGGACDVDAGTTMTITGDALDATGLVYHSWDWVDYEGRAVRYRTTGTRTTMTFDARGFEATTNVTVPVRFSACSSGYETGTCQERMTNVRVLPAARPRMVCVGGSCEVPSGLTLNILGDSSDPGLPYQRWSWTDGAGRPVFVNRSSAISQVTFNADGFAANSNQVVRVIACSNDYEVGTCVTNTITVRVTAAVPLRVWCTRNVDCEVQPGTYININANAGGLRYRYHEFRYTDPDGVDRTYRTTGSYQTTFSFYGTGYPNGHTQTIRVNTCEPTYNGANCQLGQVNVRVRQAPAPIVTCPGNNCTVQAGLPITLRGDSSAAQYRYHTYRWQDSYNVTQSSNYDSNAAQYVSTHNLPTSGFNVTGTATIGVTLFSCMDGYASGACSQTERIITLTQPPRPIVTCSTGAACTVQAGQTLNFETSSVLSQFRYHRYEWRDVNRTFTVANYNTSGTLYESQHGISFDGYNGGQVEDVTISACSAGYNAGTCVRVVQPVTVVHPAGPVLSCVGPCVVQAGRTIDLLADALTGDLQYHTWRTVDGAGQLISTNVGATGASRTSRFVFNTNSHNPTAPVDVPVEVVACRTSYVSGTCETSRMTVRLTPAPAPQIACRSGTCTMFAGGSLELEARSVNSGLRYHQWEWEDGVGQTLIYNNDGGVPAYTSVRSFSASNFQTGATRTVRLTACSGGYNSGTCASTVRDVTIRSAEPPLLVCDGPNGCQVQAGQTLAIRGDGSASRLPYHRYQWLDAAGQLAYYDVYTPSSAYRSSFNFDARYFEGAASREIELITCNGGYASGVCAARTVRVQITAEPDPEIRCGIDDVCTVQAGRQIALTGDSYGGRLRYHRWTWRDAAGTVLIQEVSANSTAYQSTVTFNANNFQGAALRTIELVACSVGYLNGACATTTRVMDVTAAPNPTVLCPDRAGCRVPAGQTMLVNGDSGTSQFPYHRWRWTNAEGGLLILNDSTASTAYRSQQTFSAAGFNPTMPQTVPASLTVCTNSYDTGSCADLATNFTVTPAVAPLMRCGFDDVCVVAAGSSLNLIGTSTISRLRYHTYEWESATGQAVRNNVAASSTLQLTQTSFDASAFTGPSSRAVTLTSCSSGYLNGTCVSTTRDITIGAGGPVRIRCNPTTCRTTPGGSITLTGDSTGPQYRYHRWTWTDSANQPQTDDRDANTTWLSNLGFPTAGFVAGNTRTVRLTACSAGYGLGTCLTRDQEVGFDHATPPVLSCANTGCEVQAGRTMVVTVANTATLRRYNTFYYEQLGGGIGVTNTAAPTSTYASNFTFNATGYDWARTVRVPVWVRSCSSYYGSGECSSASIEVVVVPAPRPTIDCTGGVCSVQAGQNIVVAGDSSNSQLRYHTWRWQGVNGAPYESNSSVSTANAYRSSRTFSADNFQSADTREIELWACSGGYRVGTCTIATRILQITAPPNPAITCSTGAACEVRAGHSMVMQADASGSRFPYLTWRWNNSTGGLTVVNQSTNSTYRVSRTFNANGYQIEAALRVEVELTACDGGYDAGTCVRTVQPITVLPAAPTDITCLNPNCRVQAGQRMQMVAVSSTSELRYHTWEWQNANNTIQRYNYDSLSSGYRSLTNFDAAGYNGANSRQITHWACGPSGYRAGTCRVTTFDVVIDAAPAPTIRCQPNADCSVLAGNRATLSGDSNASGFPYHTWRWEDAASIRQVYNTYSASRGNQSTRVFDAHGWQITRPATVEFTLTACNSYYEQGTCVTTRRDITIVPVPPPVIVCQNDVCSLQAGQTLRVTATSSIATMRYHEWAWTDALGVVQRPRYDTYNLAYRSTITFDAGNFQGATSRDVTVTACSQGYRVGSCATATRTLQITRPPAPEIFCQRGSNCSMRPGESILLSGTSTSSRFRYHQWEWADHNGRPVVVNRSTSAFSEVSSVTFDSQGFSPSADTRVPVRLTACDDSYLDGSCATATATVTVRGLDPSVITCENPGCRVQSGLTMRMTGTSSIAQLPYHTWLWEDVSGVRQQYQTNTINLSYTSSFRWAATGYTETTTRALELHACSSGYRTGSCSITRQVVTVLRPDPVRIQCVPENCEIGAGYTIQFDVDTTPIQFQYYTFSYADGTGALRSVNQNASTDYLHSWSLATTGWTAPAFRTLTVRACRDGYGVGTCVEGTRDFVVRDAPPPQFSCEFPGCRVQAGRQMRLFGDSSGATYRYHDWQWRNAAGSLVRPQYDTYNAGWRSTATFDAAGFNNTSDQPVEIDLMVCHNGYRSGSCSRQRFTVIVEPAPGAFITCDPQTCVVQGGLSMPMSADASVSGLRYHTWTWRNSGGTISTINRDGGSNRISLITFDARGFTLAQSLDVNVRACSSGYNSGTCVDTVRTIGIRTPPLPVIECESGFACRIPAGSSMLLRGDSSEAQFPYHDWRWTDGGGTNRVFQYSTAGADYRSQPSFSAAGFNVTTTRAVEVVLTACTNGYRSGSCTTATRDVIVTGAAQPAISCPAGVCTVQAGLNLTLTGDSETASLPYHDWSWLDATNTARTVRTYTTSFVSTADFSALGFQGAGSRTVTLTACSAGYLSGTCSVETQAVTVLAAPTPVITCTGSPGCEVPAGQSLSLNGDSAASSFRYHRWRWTSATGTLVEQRFLTTSGAWVSTAPFSAVGFSQSATTAVSVELAACTSGYGAGSCVNVTRNVTVLPAGAPVVTCDNNTCSVVAGYTIDIAGDSRDSGFGYHTWQYSDGTGTARSVNVDANGSAFQSTITFDSIGISANSTRDIELRTCSGGYGAGTCISRTVTLRIDAAPPATLTCSTGENCIVLADDSIDLTADSSGSLYPYHRWTWTNAAGTAQGVSVETSGQGHRSVVTFPATGFPAAGATREFTLVACARAYAAGSCTTTRVTVQIVPSGPAEITTSSVAVRPQPERAEYNFVASRPADWTIRLVRRIGGMCTTDVVHAFTETNRSAIVGTFFGLAPGASYCWSAAVTPAGMVANLDGNFTVPTLPQITAGPTADASGFDIAVTATVSAPGTGTVRYANGDCSTQQTAIRLDGSDVVTFPGRVVPTNAMSFEAWVHLRNAPGQSRKILDIGDGGAILDLASGALRLTVNNGVAQTVVSSVNVPHNQWVHIAATYVAGSRIRVYVDGLRRGELAVGATPFAYVAEWVRLGDTGARGLYGDIAGAAMYGSELDATQILAHSDAGVDGELPREPGRLAAWNFGEARNVQSVYDSEGLNAGVLGFAHTTETTDPTRRPVLTAAVAMQTTAVSGGARYAGTVSRPTGGPTYCYQVEVQTARGTLASGLGTFQRATDTTAPTITVAPVFSGECTSRSSRTLTLPLPTVSDAADESPQLWAEIGGARVTFPYRFALGDTTVTWVAVDFSGNRATANQTVRVVDTTAPVVEAGPNPTVEASSPTGTPYSASPRSASDSCTSVAIGSNAPARFPLGTTRVTFTATDAVGNTARDSYTVSVVDTTAPVFDPALRTLSLSHSGACFQPTIPNPTATDNGYPASALTITGQRTSGPGLAEGCWNIGIHELRWTVRDPAGNSRVGVQTVVVIDSNLSIIPLGFESGGAAVASGRFYSEPVDLIFSVSNGTAPYTVNIQPAPTAVTGGGGGVYRARYENPGRYDRITISVEDAGGNAGSITVDGFGIDADAPQVRVEIPELDQRGVILGNEDTYPVVFWGETVSLEGIDASEGDVELTGIGRGIRFGAADSALGLNGALLGTATVTPQLSVEMWVRAPSFALGSPFAWFGASRGVFLSTDATGRISAIVGVADSAGNVTTRTAAGPVLTANRWTHIALSHDGRYLRLFVNGAPARQVLAAGQIALPEAGSVLSLAASIVADVADVAVRSRALTATDVSAHYRGGLGRRLDATADVLALWNFTGEGATVIDQTRRGFDLTLLGTPTRLDLANPAAPGASGLTSVVARIREPSSGRTADLVTTSSNAVGNPLPIGIRRVAGRTCNGAVGGVCIPGRSTLDAAQVSSWDGGNRRAYILEVIATDVAGNSTTQQIAFRVQNFLDAVDGGVDRIDTNGAALTELSDARRALVTARSYATASLPYTDGAYLRAAQAEQFVLDAEDVGEDLGPTREYLARALTGDVRRYLESLEAGLSPDDAPLMSGARALLEDARFENQSGNYTIGAEIARDAMDRVAPLYPPYQAMRQRLRDARARWATQLAAIDAGTQTPLEAFNDAERVNRVRALIVETRNLLRDVTFREIRSALNNPLTTERRSLEAFLDRLDRTDDMLPEEEGDLIAVTNASVSGACLDLLAGLQLDDRQFTLCYLGLNDLARFLDTVSEPLVHTYRWRTGVGLALFNMLELSLYISPTGLPWIASPSSLPQVDLVLPDDIAANVRNSRSVSSVDQPDGALARAYARHREASLALAEGDLNRAWAIFVDERCLLLQMYNRYYSDARTGTHVADPKESTIDPTTVGCGP